VKKPRKTPLAADPLWYKDAIIYQVSIRSFRDSDGDGLGDIRGLTEQLDYVADLGVTAIWALPFYASPLKDDGYDISSYTDVHPDLGRIKDVKELIKAAHARGLRVITELVLNHTSDQHPWFQRARRAKPGSRERNYYVWSDTPDRYPGVRIIFKDFESSNWAWDPVAGAYYWHRFYSSQPDLNFDSPAVRQELLDVVDFWFGLGVDGLRLDAVPYLFEREGTNCENLPETHEFLKRLRAHVDGRWTDKMLLAEANQWPEDAVAYFGAGDECHMAYHFPVMPRLYMALQQEDRFPVADILEQTPEIPPGCQWAMFLRNHDELTLEMVTDRERDYMYEAFAPEKRARINLGIRRRLAPLMGGDRRKVELMNALLLSLPGAPIVYYGDEIGMGDNIYLGDRNGVRTPMQWSPDRNAGFSRANPQRLHLPVVIDPQYHYEAINVDLQQSSPGSLLWWFKRILALRKRYRAFGRGSLTVLHPENRKVLAYVREHEGERLLVVANLSRHVQAVSLDLSGFHGLTPVELLGQGELPPVGEAPYFLTLGGYSFYWFALAAAEAPAAEAPPPVLARPVDAARWWEGLEEGGGLDALLWSHLKGRRWFGHGLRRVPSLSLRAVAPLKARPGEAPPAVLLVDVDHEHERATYQLVLGLAEGELARRVEHEHAEAVVATYAGDEPCLLYDALAVPQGAAAVLQAFARRRRSGNPLVAGCPARIRAEVAEEPADLHTHTHERANTTVVFADRWVVKVFRRVAPGDHPEVELSEVLLNDGFDHVPELAGVLRHEGGERRGPTVLATLERYRGAEGDAWAYTCDALGAYLERVLVEPEGRPPEPPADLLVAVASEPPAEAERAIGAFLETVRLLGQRTGELHRVLAARTDPDLAPEEITPHVQRGLYQALRNLTGRVLLALGARTKTIPDELRPLAEACLALREPILARFQPLLEDRLTARRIRCHGHLHLGQLLFTGKDFLFIDFEGQPNRTLAERRHRQLPFGDLAGLLASFDLATRAALSAANVRPQDREDLRPWVELWRTWVWAALLRGYLEETRDAGFLPRHDAELAALIDVHRIEAALRELELDLHYERPPSRHHLRLLLDLVEGGAPA